ncbi:MAG: sugar phosphate isomerase/epimerase family protein [Planctomycetaceae bacterium]
MISRREFMAAAAASASLALGGAAVAQQGGIGEIPAVRKGTGPMKLSLAAYSFNRQLARRPEQDEPGKMTLFDFIDYCAELGLAGTELTSYYFPANVTNEYLLEIKQRTFLSGLDISGTAIGNDFCVAPGPKRDEQLQMTRDWIDYAAFMGAPVIRIFAGKTPKGETEDVALERCAEGINESVAYAATKGVVLALENHGGITSTPDQLLGIVERISPSPWFGINFDSGNFRTDDPYRDLERIAPLAVNAQIKVAVSPNGGEKEPTDLKRVVNMLKSAGYRGYVVLEYEEKEDPRKEIPKYIDQLSELL